MKASSQFFSDFRKLRVKNNDGNFSIIRMDQFLDELFLCESYFDVILPIIPKRKVLEQNEGLCPRISILEGELDLELLEKVEEDNKIAEEEEINDNKEIFEDFGEEKK